MELLLLTNDLRAETVLPDLALLIHTVRCAPSQVASVSTAISVEVVIVDARTDLFAARLLCQLLDTAATPASVVAVLTDGGLAAVNPGGVSNDVDVWAWSAHRELDTDRRQRPLLIPQRIPLASVLRKSRPSP